MKTQPIILASLLSVIMLSGCSLLSPVKSENKETYVLNTTPNTVPEKKPKSISILVSLPDARPTYNTTQMAYTVRRYQVAYFTQNQWSETPPQMLQPLIVRTLQKTHLFHAVVTPPFMGRYDYTLSTDISMLQQDFTRVPARLEFKVQAQLIKSSNNQVIGTKEFSVSEPIRYKSPYSGVAAANRATAKILREIAEFIVSKV